MPWHQFVHGDPVAGRQVACWLHHAGAELPESLAVPELGDRAPLPVAPETSGGTR